MIIRSGVLKWKSPNGWSDWIPFTNTLVTLDQPSRYAIPEQLSNYDQAGYIQPPDALLDLVDLNSNGVTGVKQETHFWAYHLDQLVWYAIPKSFLESIKTTYLNLTDKSQYQIRYGDNYILPEVTSSTGIHECDPTGWHGNGSLEFFVEKYKTDTIQVLGQTIARPTRITPDYNGFVFAFKYLDTSNIFLPYNQLITVPYRQLNGLVHWIPITCGAFYDFGNTTNSLNDPVKLTGWAAFVSQTGSWKLSRNNKISIYTNKPDCFFAIINCDRPPCILEGYKLAGYWALHQSGIFYEVDRESYIRIQQIGRENKTTTQFFTPDASILLNRSSLPELTVFAAHGLEVLWEKLEITQLNPPKPQLSLNGLPESFKEVSEDELIQIWNPNTQEWKTVTKDLVLGGSFNNQILPFSIVGIRVATYIQQLLEATPVLTEHLKLGNQAYETMKSELPKELNYELYTNSSDTTETKLKANLETLQNYLKQAQNLIEYYNVTRYSLMDENQIQLLASKAQDWVKLAPEILQDINTQAAVIISLSKIAFELQKSEMHGLIAKIQSLVKAMEASMSQISTAKTQANLNMEKVEVAKAGSTKLTSSNMRSFNTILNAITNSYTTLLSHLDEATSVYLEVKSITGDIESIDLATLKLRFSEVTQKEQDLLEAYDTVLAASIAISVCLKQLEQLVPSSVTLASNEESSHFSWVSILLYPFKLIWTGISQFFLGLLKILVLPISLVLRVFALIGFRS